MGKRNNHKANWLIMIQLGKTIEFVILQEPMKQQDCSIPVPHKSIRNISKRRCAFMTLMRVLGSH